MKPIELSRSAAKRIYSIVPFSLRRRLFRGTERFCPICSSSVRRFLIAGTEGRSNAKCPVCGSLERHRLFRIVIERYTDILERRSLRLLHVAPEPGMADFLRNLPDVDYLSADLEDPSAMVRMDITAIGFPANSFDVIQCSHVLEHVPDDRKAMREFARVLAPAGWCILQIPVTDPATFEDSSITDPEERLRVFGQRDHVRRYGPDVKERMEEAGLSATEVTTEDIASAGEAVRLGLIPGDRIYLCRIPE